MNLIMISLNNMDKIEAQGATNLKPDSLTCQPRLFSPKGNSFSTYTTISFTLDQPAHVTIKVYNVAGQLVEWIAQANRPFLGRVEIVASGLYIVTVAVGNQIQDKVVNVWSH